VETVIQANEMASRTEVLRNGFRMGEWIVRPIEGLMDGRHGSRHLQPKSMDVLLCLASAPNHIVEREDLIEHVWGRTAVTDEPLTRCIHEIRRELSDTRDKPTYIQTIPKRGYRLIAPVEPAKSDEDLEKSHPRILELLSSRRTIGVAAGTAILAILAGLVVSLWPASPTVAPAQDLNSIAVLPFETEAGDMNYEWLGVGVAEDLLNLLSWVEDLEVAAATSSFRQFADTTDIRQIGYELNVHYVLKGSVSRDGDQLRVNAHLLDAQTGFRLWNDMFDRRAGDLFAIQQEIARQVVIALELAMPMGLGEQRTALPGGSVMPTTIAPTESVKAYDYYLQARNVLLQPATPDSLTNAAEFFTQAIQYDGGFAKAYAGLCTTLVKQIRLRPATEIIDLAGMTCRRGVELDPESIDSRTAYGDLYRVTGQPEKAISQYQWVINRQPRAVDAQIGIGGAYANIADWGEAEEAYRRAVQIKPDYALAYREYSAFLFARGRYREVVEMGRHLIQLDPSSASGYQTLGAASLASGQFDTAIAAFREVVRREPTADAYSNMGAGYYYLGRYEAAIRMHRRAAGIMPLEHRIWGNIGDTYTQMGDRVQDAQDAYQRARDLAESAQQIAPDDPVAVVSLAYYCAAVHDRPCAAEHSAKAIALAPTEPSIQYYVALVNLRLGQEAAAIAAARRALELGYPRALFTVDPLLEPVRNSPRLVRGGTLGTPQTVVLNSGFPTQLARLLP